MTRWVTRGIVVVALAWMIGYLPLQFFGDRGLSRFRRLRREHSELTKRNTKLAEEIRRMRLEVERLRDDETTLERAARQDLGMVRKGELIFVLKE